MLGVKVRSVPLDGLPWAQGKPLLNLPDRLNVDETPLKAAALDSRNIITSNNDQMAIDDPARRATPSITAFAVLPQPHSYDDPAAHAMRISVQSTDADELSETPVAIGAYNNYSYHRNQRRYLKTRIGEMGSDPLSASREACLQALRGRIRQIDFWATARTPS